MPAATNALAVEGPNYVLNLGIPAGATGAAPTLTVGTVENLPAGTAATAEIVAGTEDNAYEINLGIPTGNGLGAYGGIYATSGTVNLTAANTPLPIDLGSSMTNSDNVTAGSNALTLTEGGIYSISYSVVLSPGTTGNVTVLARDDSNQITESLLTISNVTQGTLATFVKEVIVQVEAGSVIDLAVQTDQSTNNITITSASLTVKKLDPTPVAGA